MHQGEPDFDGNMSVDDVMTSVQHSTLTRLTQRASFMQPTAYQNSEVWRKFPEKLDSL